MIPPIIFTRLAPLIPTEVFDTYWRFAAERQMIFFRRLEGAAFPWTQDAILQRYKFTNAYRASDRVSQYLIRNVIYRGDQSAEEVFFRILLFKIFNRIETWQLLESKFGELRFSEYSFERYDTVLKDAMNAGRRIFSAAYIMPSGEGSFGYAKKHRNYLRLLEVMMADEVPIRITEMRSMRNVFELLRSYPLIGDFLAYQYAIDINYSQLTNFSEMEFVVPGPGARDGIRKCFQTLMQSPQSEVKKANHRAPLLPGSRQETIYRQKLKLSTNSALGGLTEADIIRLMAERQGEEFARLGLDYRSLWGRPLQLIDCQNLFCEVGKYARLAHPEIRGISERRRVKQLYHPDSEPVQYWYPPKWGINHLILEGNKDSSCIAHKD